MAEIGKIVYVRHKQHQAKPPNGESTPEATQHNELYCYKCKQLYSLML